MEILQDPNIAYLLLIGGLMFALLALLSPGTGLLEIGALFALLLAGWGVYNNPINLWALVVLGIGVALFVAAVRFFEQQILMIVAILFLVLGAAFLFSSNSWYLPRVDPFLAGVVSLLSGGFFWVASRKAIEAGQMRPSHDLGELVGSIGEARSSIHEEGSVQVFGELWSARSDQPIPAGTQIRVVSRQGFTLEVEALPEEES